jgi:hypothetical protein
MKVATALPAALYGDEADVTDFYERVVPGVARGLWQRMQQNRDTAVG